MKNYLLIPYITAGFPSKKFFVPILETLSKYDADYIEVGVPHSDPLADGPVIQQSSKIALENGVTLNWIVEMLCATSLQKKLKPLILFSYFNPILKYGLKKLLHDLPKPLFCGLIIPDLPLEEAQKYLSLFKKHKLNFIPLVAPTTKIDRLKKIVGAYGNTPSDCGFIYLVSVTGVTGVRKKLSSDLKRKIKEIKSVTNIPVVVGFGISNSRQAKEVISWEADGVIVGSALIKTISNKNEYNVIQKLESFMKSYRNLT